MQKPVTSREESIYAWYLSHRDLCLPFFCFCFAIDLYDSSSLKRGTYTPTIYL